MQVTDRRTAEFQLRLGSRKCYLHMVKRNEIDSTFNDEVGLHLTRVNHRTCVPAASIPTCCKSHTYIR